MLVPITRGLQHDLAVHAAVLLASLAIGEMLAPVAVKRLKRTGTSIRPSALALFLGGVVLVLVALLVSALDGGAELVAVAAFLIVFGAVTYSASSFLIAGAADSIADDAQAGLAAFFISVGIATPIGTLLWGRLIDFAGPGSSMLLSGVAMAVVALATVGVVLWIYRRSAPANAEGAEPLDSQSSPLRSMGSTSGRATGCCDACCREPSCRVARRRGRRSPLADARFPLTTMADCGDTPRFASSALDQERIERTRSATPRAT